MGWGPVSTTIGHRWTEELWTDGAGRDRHGRALRIGGDLDLGFVKPFLPQGLPPGIGAMVPDSIWVAWSGGPEGDARTTGQRSDWSIGSSWGFDGWYASLSGWRSQFDHGRSEWVGTGSDLSVGVYDEMGGADVYVSLSRSDEAEVGNRASESMIGAGLSAWFKHDDLPRTTGSLQFDGYQGAFPDWAGEERSSSVSASFGLDLSDYLGAGAGEGGGTLRLVYTFSRDTYTSHWSDWRSGYIGMEHFIGVAARMRF
jgi:hypothetical protein